MTQNPSASSSSCPGVRIVTATGSPPIRISSGSSTATTSVSVKPSGRRSASTTLVEYGGASLGSPAHAGKRTFSATPPCARPRRGRLERRRDRRLPGPRDRRTPQRPEKPEVRPQLARVLELGLAVELAQLEGLEDVRNRAAHEPEVHAVGRFEAHGLDGRRGQPVRARVVRGEHDVLTALEHLELSARAHAGCARGTGRTRRRTRPRAERRCGT